MIVNVAVLSDNASTTKQLETQQSATIKARDELQSKSLTLERMEEEKIQIESSLREERLKSEEIQQENQSLKVSLQAKKEREAKAAEAARLAQTQVTEAPRVAQKAAAPRPAVSGNKEAWLAASGIPQSEWASVDFIVSRESGWNPNAVNPTSGACGLGQQLPCGKWAGAWNDPVAALKNQHIYVQGRYYEGSPYVPKGMCANASRGYPCAVAFWKANRWY